MSGQDRNNWNGGLAGGGFGLSAAHPKAAVDRVFEALGALERAVSDARREGWVVEVRADESGVTAAASKTVFASTH